MGARERTAPAASEVELKLHIPADRVAEVERALHEWPDLVRDLRAETARGTLPTAALQARGYRSYPVRRAILRCFYRELAG